MLTGRSRVTCPTFPFLQAAVTSQVAEYSVERTGARRALAGRDDSPGRKQPAGGGTSPGPGARSTTGSESARRACPRKPSEAQRPASAGIRAPRHKGWAWVLPRHAGNRAEKLSQGAAQAQRTSVPTALILALGVNPCTFAGNTQPARPGAETHQSADQVEPVRRVPSRTVRGLIQPRRRACHRSSLFRHLLVCRLHGPGEAIRVLPLVTSPLRVSTAHLPEATENPTPGPAGDPASGLASKPWPLRRPGWP